MNSRTKWYTETKFFDRWWCTLTMSKGWSRPQCRLSTPWRWSPSDSWTRRRRAQRMRSSSWRTPLGRRSHFPSFLSCPWHSASLPSLSNPDTPSRYWRSGSPRGREKCWPGCAASAPRPFSGSRFKSRRVLGFLFSSESSQQCVLNTGPSKKYNTADLPIK